jgi:hypothetical protein
MARILEDQEVLQFNCLGDMMSQFRPVPNRVPIPTVLHKVIETCCTKF